MKTRRFFITASILLAAYCLLPTCILAQAPQAFNYQSVVRGSDGKPLVNTAITLKAAIHEGSSSGTVVYEETHSVSTNQFGLINLAIGNGSVVSQNNSSGKIAGTFSSIPWENGNMWIAIKADFGSGFEAMGVSQLLSVPYALYAGNIKNPTTAIDTSLMAVTDTIVIGTTDTIVMHRTDTVVIINTGINCWDLNSNRINDPDEDLDSNGVWNALDCAAPADGNAWLLLGNAGTVDGTNFIGTTDSVAFNIRVNNKKAGRIDPNGATFLGCEAGNNNTSPKVTGVGYQALFSNTTGGYNSAIGRQGLYNNTTGNSNTANGHQTLFSNTTGSYNTASGTQALYSNTTGRFNTANGDQTLYYNTTGFFNTATGAGSLQFNTTGSSNSAYGAMAMQANITGSGNSANGYSALRFNTTGENNTASGTEALFSNTNGGFNTANGAKALYTNSSGIFNCAQGALSLYNNNTGNGNTATGAFALHSNTTGNENTATGSDALKNNLTGNNNTAIGKNALFSNTTGYNNTAIGFKALYSNTQGNKNTAIGDSALYNNTEGGWNFANGDRALYKNTTGCHNTASGSMSLFNNTTGRYNTAIGKRALLGNKTGDYNTAIGDEAFLDGDNYRNSTALGRRATVTSSNMVRLGDYTVSSIGGQVGWTTVSDARVKMNVQENVQGLAFIRSLRPVTYNYNIEVENELLGVSEDTATWEGKDDIKKMQFSGFLAQEVEAAAQKAGYNFSGVDKSGVLWGLRYAEFVVPLVKGMQEQQQVIEDYKIQIANLQSANTQQEIRLKKLEEAINTKTSTQ